jgi:carbonic anhydrase
MEHNGAMAGEGRFAAVITCIDGRIQNRTLDHAMTRFGVRYVDNITAAGAVKHLAGEPTSVGESLLNDLALSASYHGTKQVALIAHTDCAGNAVPDETQRQNLRHAAKVVSDRFPDLEIVALLFDPRLGFEKIS